MLCNKPLNILVCSHKAGAGARFFVVCPMDTTDSVAKAVTTFIEPFLEEMDFELVEVEYLSERGRWVLRVFVDKQGGITVEDCARISREIGDVIEVKDCIPHGYVLEVSSPGLNRPLKKEKDLLWAIGRKVKIKMGAAMDGRRNFTGYLRSFRNGMVYLEVENNLIALPWGRVAKANLVYEFDN
jgi:ribosome maturation factor RimP